MSVAKAVLRSAIGAKKHETIQNAIIRHKINFQKKIYKQHVNKNDFIHGLQELDIQKCENLMVHCSWRACYNVEFTPKEMIELLLDQLPENFTLLMPSYGQNKESFDVQRTKSAAGVLSEVFRKEFKIQRSECAHFSIAGIGEKSEYFLGEHSKSVYGFDENSPYFKFAKCDKSHILFIGLGEIPTQMSVFHCSSWLKRNTDLKLKNVYSNYYKTDITSYNNVVSKEMVTRSKPYGNNNSKFRKAFKMLKNTKKCKVSNIDLVLVDANEALEKSIDLVENNFYFYKKL